VEDLAEAARLYRLAADQGNADAQYRLGMMYMEGTGVGRDLVEAARLLRLAADQGDADAQYQLGLMYHIGKGVAEDLAEAARLLWLAADQGSVYAVYANSILANMYANGKGVTEDLAEAARLYRLVAAADIDEGNERVHVDAQHNLERLNRKLGHGNGIPMSDAATPEDSVQAGNLASGGKPDGTVKPPRKPTAWNYFLQVRATHPLGCPVISCARAVHFARRLGLAGHSRLAQVFRRVSAQRFGRVDLLPSRFRFSDAGLSFGDIAKEAATRWRALSKQDQEEWCAKPQPLPTLVGTVIRGPSDDSFNSESAATTTVTSVIDRKLRILQGLWRALDTMPLRSTALFLFCVVGWGCWRRCVARRGPHQALHKRERNHLTDHRLFLNGLNPRNVIRHVIAKQVEAAQRVGPKQAAKETAKKETERKEAAKRELERKEAERKEAAKKETEGKEAARREAERKEAAKKEAERKEAAKKETERQARARALRAVLMGSD
jgi:hypothetical protein